MAVVETSGIIKHKDSSGNMVFFYPITLKDNVSGMEDIDNHLTDQNNPHNVTAEQVGALSSTPAEMTSTDGVTYTCTVPGITTITVGTSFIGIPKTESTSQAVKLNVNSFGAKLLRRRVSAGSATTASGYNNSWIAANKPVRVIYDGSFWVVDIVQPHASDLMGSVPVAKGGTGATTASTACDNLNALSKAGGTMTGPLGLTQDVHYGSVEPSAPIEGQVFFKQVNVAELVYPVGAIYMSTISTSPATLFGFGTWERIQDTFLLAAGSTYSAGSTGGEATVTLTENEIPAHRHKIAYPNAGGDYGDAAIGYPSSSNVKKSWLAELCKTESVGGGAAHNNMPPYLAVYCWQRTA